jgi:hypothetical protein
MAVKTIINKLQMTTYNHTIVLNGIELNLKEDGQVEVFCDRPSVVQIEDLQQVLQILLTASAQNEEASQTSFDCPQSLYNQHEESGHTLEPGEARYFPKDL